MDVHITLPRGLSYQEKLGSPSSLDFALSFLFSPYFLYCVQWDLGWREAVALGGEETREILQQILTLANTRLLEAWPECGSQAQVGQSSLSLFVEL